MVQKAVCFIQGNTGVDAMPSIANMRLLKKSTASVCWALSKKQSQRKPVDQSLQNKLNQLKRKNDEADITKSVDCFLDGYGS